MVTEIEFPVRYAETDQMGIVHHSVYAIWFECGRTEHIKSFGMTYAELEEAGALLPLLKLSCEFHIPLKYGDTAIVKTRLISAGKTRVLFGYSVHETTNGPACTTGTTEHAWTNAALKPVNLSRHYPDIFSRMLTMYDCATGK